MVALQVAEQMCDYLLNGSVVNAINMPSVSAEDAPKLRPYMLLGELLGSISGQVCNSGFKSITIEYEGQASELNTRPITACVLKGLLSPMMDSVNMVNASVVARERNIAVSVVNHERDCEYQTLVSLQVSTEARHFSVSGTLFGGDKPRIVDIDGVPMEASLSVHSLYTRNSDKAGIIAGFGKAFADAKINIANFVLGRTRQGGDAVCLIEVDDAIPSGVIDNIRLQPNVHEVTQLYLPMLDGMS